MNLENNTLLITGGGSGIGRALAEQFYALGNQVIIAGRRQDALDQVAAARPGMATLTLDVADPASIEAAAVRLRQDHPTLNGVIHAAGIQQFERIQDHLGASKAMAGTNLLGPIQLTSVLLPLLEAQARATIILISSGLAFLPMAVTPTYSATKAGIHSYAQSLRYQLRSAAVQVIELVPPYVATGLMGDWQAQDPTAMPLDEFISETLSLLERYPDAHEVLVERVKPLRFAEQGEDYPRFFTQFNQSFDGVGTEAP